jgi:BlaI family penicillinase repressor
VLAVLWRKAPLTASQVFESLAADKTWKLNTVRTFLTRLEKKGAVRSREGADARQFLPAVSREACVRQESDSFLARVFDGGTAALLLHFARSKRLSASELAELEAILARKRQEKK